MLVRRPAWIYAGAALTAAVALSGCSGSGGDAAPSTAASAKVTINDAGISPKDLATPPALKDVEGARKDLTMDGQCDTKLGDQKVTGTLKSSAKEARDYVIVINWVHGSDVMGRAVKLLEKVQPGQEVKVELTTKLTKAADGCTVNVTRGQKA
ncbi:hypothetical protein MM440_01475 [Arsenicicoccus piscis]|uniref:Lipoprotein n=1 Tax=Arsenicicoccus piscis TaxID=673954 RepID=A0ABQ6HU70_9MICO|nr:hypothetical protein [Arsenicicoccus piscis]MCH8626488.1 hypothetical protein [Arsenicicoccus piscis]GMA21120.1 hypothetical protein GCM10025862_31410 [Arsenicicoccus piscis]